MATKFLLQFAVGATFFVVSPIASMTNTEICDTVKDEPRLLCVRDYDVDVVIMFDQSGSLKTTNVDELRKDLKAWVKSYFDIQGVNKSQFAVLGCDPPRVYHRFSDGNFSQKVPDWIENITKTPSDGMDNLHNCSDLAAREIFDAKSRHRPNVANIALWISDCNFIQFQQYPEAHMGAAKRLLFERNVDFFFVCCKPQDGSPFRIFKENQHSGTYWTDAMRWLSVRNLSNPNDSVILYQGKQSLSDSIDKVIPFKIVNVTDCMYVTWKTNCTWVASTGNCKWDVYYEILRPPFPPTNRGGKFGKPCPINETGGKECTCPIKSTEESKLKDEPPKSVVSIVVGVIGGLLVLIVVLVVAALLVARRRKRKVGRVVGQAEAKKIDKGKGISANISVMGDGASKVSKIDDGKSVQSKLAIGKSSNSKSMAKKSETSRKDKSVVKKSAMGFISERKSVKKPK